MDSDAPAVGAGGASRGGAGAGGGGGDGDGDVGSSRQVRPLRFRRLDEDGEPRPDHQQQEQDATRHTQQLATKSGQQRPPLPAGAPWRRHRHPQSPTVANGGLGGEISPATTVVQGAASNNGRQQEMTPTHPSAAQQRLAVDLEGLCFSVDARSQSAGPLADLLLPVVRCLPACLAGAGAAGPKRQVQILKSVQLRVPRGSIFGLLGPSSCGKTTLLRCLVGLLRPSAGTVRLFGRSVNKRPPPPPPVSQEAAPHLQGAAWFGSAAADGQATAATSVGYMPQDLGLYEDFSIWQILTMFGQYVRMEGSLIAERIQFLAHFLDLPHVDRRIASLSGGQKRRVSFAIACLHLPPLIILDEPTVGVDPLLRKNIWLYLRHLARVQGRTIIITTHYIEEAAHADQVALMRAGQVLVQGAPKAIMAANKCSTLEEAFLAICSSIDHLAPAAGEQATHPSDTIAAASPQELRHVRTRAQLSPRAKFTWPDEQVLADGASACDQSAPAATTAETPTPTPTTPAPKRQVPAGERELIVQQLRLRAAQKVALLDSFPHAHLLEPSHTLTAPAGQHHTPHLGAGRLAGVESASRQQQQQQQHLRGHRSLHIGPPSGRRLHRLAAWHRKSLHQLVGSLRLLRALLYKNYRRNVNSWPLLAFQFLLPIVQMVSFSLCIGGRPQGVGLGLVNADRPYWLAPAPFTNSVTTTAMAGPELLAASNGTAAWFDSELLSERYLSFIDSSMLAIRSYENLDAALADVRRAKLWAAMEIGSNFSEALVQRFDADATYRLDDLETVRQSIIHLYTDSSNKVLDMICQRSLVDSYRRFLLNQFQHLKRLPVEMRDPIYQIKPNLISNSIDGYTESIAAGLLASLTYIMAAGLTTFIMVVERGAGILERTYTCGVSPTAYLLAHALFRSFVMMIQIGLVMFLTFYMLRQPMEGSLSLAYAMLMMLNVTGITYGLLISSLVSDQNGAALIIVSSLVVKITMSGILWPLEAVPRLLRPICLIQPLTMPVQALKAITLKGATLTDRTVVFGFVVSVGWMLVFIWVATRRFRFYQH